MIKLTAKERIEKVVCWAGLSTNAFAVQIGLSSPQTLYQIKSEKHQISRSIAERICTRYPEIDFGWLLAGEGEMLRPQEGHIPYFNVDCSEVLLGKCLTPSGVVIMPHCGDCDFAAPYYSRSMEPAIKQGSILFCRKCEVENLSVGMTILVDNGKSAFVRKVSQIDSMELLLEAEAKEVLSTRLDLSLLGAIYEIKAVLEWKNI